MHRRRIYKLIVLPRYGYQANLNHQPNVMYERDHPAYSKLQELGREITTKVKPRAVVVFSAHWQAGPDTIQVNTAEITDLIYE